jgi:hypothetical protein
MNARKMAANTKNPEHKKYNGRSMGNAVPSATTTN